MRKLIVIVIILLSSPLVASEQPKPLYGPVLKSYGPYFKIENRDSQLPTKHSYKVVFDITKTAEDKTAHSRYLESVARFMNMHAANGIKVEDMSIAVVLHGASTKDSLNDDAYKRRYQTDNPNLDLIKALSDKGVQFYLCGQSAAFSGINKDELSSEISLALSAMTMLTLLQQEGYALIP